MTKTTTEDFDSALPPPRMDRRARHEAKQRKAGYTRTIVRCHNDDVAKVKAYAARLLLTRRAGGVAKDTDQPPH